MIIMNEHKLKLATEPFEAISSGKKTIESRLFDEKRQAIQLGDTIIFTNQENPSQTLKVKVIGLLRYCSFAELFNHNAPEKFGGKSIDWLVNQISEFYTDEDQKLYGVVGIEFVRI
jgi:ASC-1-like (ASCH) protein